MYSPTDFDSVGEFESVWKSDDKGTKSAYHTVYHLPKGITQKIRQKKGSQTQKSRQNIVLAAFPIYYKLIIYFLP